MELENYTHVTEFVLVGFPGLQQDYFQLVAWFFFFFFLYVVTVVGNFLRVVVFAVEHSLQQPMYITMVSLALSDIGFSTVALPKVIARYWWDAGQISFYACLIQKQFIHYFGTLNSLIMMTMAMDRYLSICHPFSSAEATGQTKDQVTAVIAPGITTYQSAFLRFCGSNKIIHCFCDTSSVNRLACLDSTQETHVSVSPALFVLLLPFHITLFSYICIIVTLMKMSTSQSRWKAFSTCSSQLCIISVYYIPRCSVYTGVVLPLKISVDFKIVLTLFCRMVQMGENYTRVTEFVLVGFPGLQPGDFQLVAWLFFFIYMVTVKGNLLLVVVFAVEHSLQKPMYIIMVSLALSDIGFSTVALPKIIARYWWDAGQISFYACLIQKQFIHYFGTLNSLIMMTMAMDRYLAICHPLRYHKIMTNGLMSGLTVFSWVTAMIAPGITTYQSALLPFCGSNKIINCFCDTTALNRLACADTTSEARVAFSVAMFVLLLPFGIIIFSYICIIATVMKMSTSQSRWKAFSTCSSQLCIISVYYIPRCSVYTSTVFPMTISLDLRIGMAFLYSLLPPLLNPFIYCLRTKEIQRTLTKRFRRGKPVDHKPANVTLVDS
ncbi:olfactory receptor 1E16-like [Aplochiton taeniatus]